MRDRVEVQERHRHTETVVVPNGKQWFVESYRPRLSFPTIFIASGAPFEFGEWLDWIRSRGGWLVAIRSTRGIGRVQWWERVDGCREAERLRGEIAEHLKSGRWP